MDFSPEEFDEILNIFRAETEEIIEKLNNNLLSLENTPKDKDILMHMFRDAHSLKGAARMIGFNNIQRLAHKIEDVLGLAKENKIVINSMISDVLYKSLDFLSEIIQKSISIKKEYYTDDIQKHIDNIDKTLEIHNSDLYTNDRDIAIKSEAENFDIKNFRKNVSTLDAQIIESFLIMSKMEMDDDIKYLDTFYDIVQKLIEIIKPFNLYEINSILQDIEMKLAFVMQNSHIITKEESEGVDAVEGTLPRQEGDRLAASYVNYYTGNGFVAVPVFNDPNDQKAIDLLQSLYPDRVIEPIYAREILLGGGNIHCITQQVPRGDAK